MDCGYKHIRVNEMGGMGIDAEESGNRPPARRDGNGSGFAAAIQAEAIRSKAIQNEKGLDTFLSKY